jgi:hypothetical protein
MESRREATSDSYCEWKSGCRKQWDGQYDWPLSRYQPMSLTIGEVHTGLLLTSAAVSAETAATLLAILPGGSVRSRQRPVRCAWSPEVLTGVDCLAPNASQREVRVVGTPTTRVWLTDGRIVQAATHATLTHDPAGRRHPWAHYLARPGVLEVLGTESDDNLATGFLSGHPNGKSLDLGAVNVRVLAAIQRSELLDQDPPFHTRRTRLRWSAQSSESAREIVFTLSGEDLRSVRLRTTEVSSDALAEFCTDLALHDWLLSVLLELVERAVARKRPAAELIRLLRPGIDHLVHAWMPAAHASRALIEIWQEFDRDSAFSLQWQKTVERIRDQLSIGLIEALQSPVKAARSESA